MFHIFLFQRMIEMYDIEEPMLNIPTDIEEHNEDDEND